MPPINRAFGPEDFAAASDVSRETLELLKLYAAMLDDWNTRYNLVSQSSLDDVWRRHFWDSAQVFGLIPATATSLIDLGSGAGFPGLVLATMLREKRDFRVVLTEATTKKCLFLEAVAARLELNVEIRNARIEDMRREVFGVVTARACKPLVQLIAYAQGFWGQNTVGLFLKGQNVESELTEANKSWNMGLQRHPSRSDLSGVILEVRELQRGEPKRSQKRG